MIEQILPGGVATAEAFVDPPGLVPHPSEEALIGRAVEKRRREFVTTRHLARQAMGKLGVPSAAVMRGERGAPLWPQGVVGSLAHCDGYRGAVLAYSMQVRSLGIDAEPHGPLPDGVLPAVSIEAERTWLDTQETGGPVHWDRVLFCAKEATYKAWFPLTGRWLGFEDATSRSRRSRKRPALSTRVCWSPVRRRPVRRSPLSTAGGWCRTDSS